MVIYELLTLRLPHMHVFPEEDQFESEESFQEAWEEAEEVYENSLGKLMFLYIIPLMLKRLTNSMYFQVADRLY